MTLNRIPASLHPGSIAAAARSDKRRAAKLRREAREAQSRTDVLLAGIARREAEEEAARVAALPVARVAVVDAGDDAWMAAFLAECAE